MFTYIIRKINSKDTCKLFASVARDTARQLDIRATQIAKSRDENYKNISDARDFKRVLKWLVSDPQYFLNKRQVCERYARTFGFRYDTLSLHAKNWEQKESENRANERRSRIYELFDDGVKQVEIAEIEGVSPAYISKTIRRRKNQAEAQKYGLCRLQYEYMKRNSTLPRLTAKTQAN